MSNFDNIKNALEYIDSHLDEPMSFETLARRFHFSPYYFHRMFSVIVGKAITAYIRDRRLMRACIQLADTDKSILGVGLDCGYSSAQAFSRAFRGAYGLPPSEYRRQEFVPVIVTVDEMIMKFTNRIRGGVFVNPKIIKRNEIIIACTVGDGFNTLEVWQAFEKLNGEKPLRNKLSDNGYEFRLHDGEKCVVYTGYAVSDEQVDDGYTVFKIPASAYASFDVYPANGYDSENEAMYEWLASNGEGYTERLLDNRHYCVEFYDERFNGNEAGSIMEIWYPIEKGLTGGDVKG
ncbi:MAG: AraC family transcriptional regulator [Defluviitaleaceae bacterium]|nr:AraC family transcriptional regulator [Defluviitaleaceae bacterium]MCL2835628.1 AraC family transcriptional regulator [Defluviitaleaceae bacterium]